MRIAVVGASGYVGSAVVAAARAAGHEVRPVGLRDLTEGLPERAWRAELVAEVAGRLGPVDAVVNAAGLPTALAPDVAALLPVNAHLPALLQHAAEQAGAGRFVHVSSAAVQGRRDPLDDGTAYDAASPYAASKRRAEELLAGSAAVVYRPTSVLGPGKGLVAWLRRYLELPVVPVVDGGHRPLPFALVDDVGRACVLLAEADDPPLLVTHPSDNVTVAGLLAAYRPSARTVSLPPRLLGATLRSLDAAGPRGRGIARRGEVLLIGQRVATTRLRELGLPAAPASAYAGLLGPQGGPLLRRGVRRQ